MSIFTINELFIFLGAILIFSILQFRFYLELDGHSIFLRSLQFINTIAYFCITLLIVILLLVPTAGYSGTYVFHDLLNFMIKIYLVCHAISFLCICGQQYIFTNIKLSKVKE